MRNTTSQPLECLSVTTTTPPAKGVWVNTEKTPNGWETVAFVDGSFICSCSSKHRQYTIDDVHGILKTCGHKIPGQPKQLAPVMSARMPKKSTRKAA